MANYSDIKYQPAGSSTTTYSDMAALIAATGMSSGDQALVTALNKVFMYTGSAWYLVATMTNASPTAITGASATYTLATDGTATTITAVSTDPEGFALTWSYAVTTGSLGSTATVSQVDNVFTITPSTDSANAGTFGITFSVTDGATGAVNAVSAFTLGFGPPNVSITEVSTSTQLQFGEAVASSDTHFAVGVPRGNIGASVSSQNAGNIYLRTINGTAVTGFDPLFPLDQTNARFGASVALSATHLAVGADCVGQVKLYSLTSATPIFTKNEGAYFGHKVNLSPAGNYLAAGNYNYSSNTGRVYIYAAKTFTDSGGTSRTQGDLIHTLTGSSGSRFGWDISMTDTKILIGARTDGSYGKAYLYNLIDGSQVTAGVWPLAGVSPATNFGQRVALSDDYASISDSRPDSGAMTIVRMSDNTTLRTQTGTGKNGTAIIGDYVYGSDNLFDSGGLTDNGRLRAFKLSDGVEYTLSNHWPSVGTQTGDQLGTTLHGQGGTLIAGATRHVPAASGWSNAGKVQVYS